MSASNASPGSPSSDDSPPRKLHGLTPLELQQRQLEKLMKNPDKPVSIPEPKKERTVKPPRDIIRNVQGSSAGAGSGEFHVYRQVRRREYARIKDMEEKALKENEEEEFQTKLAQTRAAEEERTAKKREKRQKKKARKQNGSKDVKSGAKATDHGGDAEVKETTAIEEEKGDTIGKRNQMDTEGEIDAREESEEGTVKKRKTAV